MTTLGVLYPGHAAEDDYARLGALVRPRVRMLVAHTAVGENTNSVEDARRTGEIGRLLDGVRELRERGGPDGVAAVLWACTAGSFVLGLEGARQQSRELSEVAGVPASSTSLAFVGALRALGVGRVSVAATYPLDEAAFFASFLAEAAVDVLGMGSAGIEDGSGGALMAPEDVIAFALANDRPGAAAILLPDTAVRTADMLERLERAAGKPVLTANQVTVWAGLRLARRSAPTDGLGALFRV